MRPRLVLLVILTALFCAGPARAIIGGQPDGGGHPYVGVVTDGSSVCSGSLLTPTVFVTAAHCFDRPGKIVRVSLAESARGSVFVEGTWHPDPLFCIGCGPGLLGADTHDMAVVRLSSPLFAGRFAALPTPGQVDALPNKTEVTLVGYGVQGLWHGGGPPVPFTDFTRRSVAAQLITSNHAAGDEFVRVAASKGGICHGDSGGPVLLGDTVLAENSFVTNSNCAGVTYAYRFDTAAALGFVAGF